MSYSCGKDSTLELHKMILQGHTPVALLCDDYIFLHGDMGNLQSVSSVECYAGGFMSDNDILLHRPAQGCG